MLDHPFVEVPDVCDGVDDAAGLEGIRVFGEEGGGDDSGLVLA